MGIVPALKREREPVLVQVRPHKLLVGRLEERALLVEYTVSTAPRPLPSFTRAPAKDAWQACFSELNVLA